jgi:hypothetical protein
MKHLYLIRTSSSDLCTMGALHENGLPFLCTLENPWVFNKENVSCIPEGEYIVEPFDSELHPNTWRLMNVPDRSAILIHIGNRERDTEGCILPGMSYGELKDEPAVLNSAKAMKTLEYRVGREKFKLTIKRG